MRMMISKCGEIQANSKFHIRQDPNLGPCCPENAPYWDKRSEVVKSGPETAQKRLSYCKKPYFGVLH